MADYPPPTQTLPNFNSAVFRANDIPLTIAEAENYFVSFPTAQGAVNLSSVNVSGTINVTNSSAKATVYGFETTVPSGTGEHNTAFGYQAGKAFNTLTTTGGNTAFGALAMAGATLLGATNNTAIGHNSLLALSSGDDNTAVGVNSLHLLTTGIHNIGIGRNAGDTITTGGNNTCIGYNADVDSLSSTFRTAIGSGASGTANSTITLGRVAASATRADYEVVRLNHIEPQYTTLTQTLGNVGYQYSPATSFVSSVASGSTIATQALPIGIWSINVAMAFTGTYVIGSLAIQIGGTTIAVIPIVETTGTGSLVAAANGSIIYAMTTAATATLIYDGTASSTMTETASSVFQITRIA